MAFDNCFRKSVEACLIVLGSGLCLSDRIAPAATPQDDLKAKVIKAWKDRQERVKSARFSWTNQHTDAQGVISRGWAMTGVPAGKDPVPPKDLTYPATGSAAFDGVKLRYEYTTRYWPPDAKEYESGTFASTFDGATCKILHGPSGSMTWHQGQVRREEFHIEFSTGQLQPLLMTFRPLTKKMHAYDIDDFEVTSAEAMIDKRPCIEFTQRAKETSRHFYVDPERDYCVVRLASLRKGIVTKQVNVRYVQDAAASWVPKEWDVFFNSGDGKLMTADRVRVISHEINALLPASDFDIVFPPGTKVTDSKNGVNYIVKPETSEKRVIEKHEMTAKYEELVATPRGQAGKVPSGTAWVPPWTVYVLLVTTVVSVATLWGRRYFFASTRRDS